MKPTVEQAQRSLRIDDDLLLVVQDALDRAYATVLNRLDVDEIYPTIEAREIALAATPSGRFQRVGIDIQKAVLLLADVEIGANDAKDSLAKEEAAYRIIDSYRLIRA